MYIEDNKSKKYIKENILNSIHDIKDKGISMKFNSIVLEFITEESKKRKMNRTEFMTKCTLNEIYNENGMCNDKKILIEELCKLSNTVNEIINDNIEIDLSKLDERVKELWRTLK